MSLPETNKYINQMISAMNQLGESTVYVTGLLEQQSAVIAANRIEIEGLSKAQQLSLGDRAAASERIDSVLQNDDAGELLRQFREYFAKSIDFEHITDPLLREQNEQAAENTRMLIERYFPKSAQQINWSQLEDDIRALLGQDTGSVGRNAQRGRGSSVAAAATEAVTEEVKKEVQRTGESHGKLVVNGLATLKKDLTKVIEDTHRKTEKVIEKNSCDESSKSPTKTHGPHLLMSKLTGIFK